MNRDQTVFAPVSTVADEALIRFVIYTGSDDFGRHTFDDFSVGRRDAAEIIRKHHHDRAHIERPEGASRAYLGDVYIEPCDDVVSGLVQVGERR